MKNLHSSEHVKNRRRLHKKIALHLGVIASAGAVWFTATSTHTFMPRVVDTDYGIFGINDSPAGFASIEGGTTGGNPANTCPVEVVAGDAVATTKNLLAAVECIKRDPSGGVITFSPAGATARITKTIHLPSNVTLQGPVKLEDASIRINGQENIIIRNIIFTTLSGHTNAVGSPCPDPTATTTRGTGVNGTSGCPTPILIGGSTTDVSPGRAKSSKHIWIDHNVFDRCGDKCVVLTTGAVRGNGNYTGTDLVTISNNIFKNSFLATLFTYQGSALRPVVNFSTQACEALRDSPVNILPTTRVSVYGNLFSNVHQRSVRAAYCTTQVHEFNNAIIGNSYELSEYPTARTCEALAGKGPESVYGASILFENNYVSMWKDGPPTVNGVVCTGDIVQTGQLDVDAGVDKLGYIKLKGNRLLNGAVAHENDPHKVDIVIPYTYTPLSADEAYARIMQTAGNALINNKASR